MSKRFVVKDISNFLTTIPHCQGSKTKTILDTCFEASYIKRIQDRLPVHTTPMPKQKIKIFCFGVGVVSKKMPEK